MKVIYIHQHFATPEGSTGTRSHDVSKHMASMGHEIVLICGCHEQSGLPRSPWWRLFKSYSLEGFKVVVCNVPYSNKMGVVRRLWSFIGFALFAMVAGLRECGVDLVFATSTPLTVGIPGRVVAALKRVPYVFEVRDLWPEDLLAAGRIRPGLQYSVWEWIERFSYAKAARILLVSRGFHDRLLERGLAPEKLRTILLGADSSFYENLQPDREYLRQHGVDGKTVAVYAGAHGDANGLVQLVDAAEHLRDRPDTAIVLLGDGSAKAGLVKAVRDRGLSNVHLLDAVPKHRLPGVLAACDIGLMILKQITRPRWVTPNKIFDFMFAGLPSIVNFSGTVADLVVADGAGVASQPGSAADLAARIVYWADHPEDRAAIGRRARQLAFEKYDRKRIAEQLVEVFETVVAEAPSGRDR